MDVTIAVTGDRPADELRALRRWLAEDDDLAGLVGLVRLGATAPGSAAPPGDDLVVAVGDHGGAAALAQALVAWIRDHTHDLLYEVTRPDGVSVRLRAKRVRETNGAMVRELITELCRFGASESRDEGAPTGAAVE